LEALEALNILDWVIIALLFGGIFLGYIRGFISQLVSIAGLFIAYIAAYMFYDDLAPWIAKIIPLSSWETYEQYQLIFNSLHLDTYLYNAVSFAIIFFAVKIGLSLMGHFFNLIAKVPGLNMINKWSGAFLALIEVALLVIVSVNVMAIIPSESVQLLVADSYIANFLYEQIPNVAERLHHLWND
jgi:uncharacterized membrane protein required for colicin V production